MRYIRRRDNPNTLVGLLLLAILAVLAGPNTLPTLISSLTPFFAEGVACENLRASEDRTMHQSLIGRSVGVGSDPPISLDVRMSAINMADPNEPVTISVIVRNTTIGTIPILITPNTLILNPGQAQNGLGIIVGTTPAVTNVGEAVTSYPDSRIRLLGPRQRCVQEIQIPIGQIPNASALTAANSTLRAFYRNNVRGTVQPTGAGVPIFTDQGLWTGVVESPPRVVGTG